jgi:hypothetical protein
MPSFKMTIPEGTNLWNAIGSLPSKARNAELYRLAASGLIADTRGQQADVLVGKPATKPENTNMPTQIKESGFVSIDLENDLMGLLGNKL